MIPTPSVNWKNAGTTLLSSLFILTSSFAIGNEESPIQIGEMTRLYIEKKIEDIVAEPNMNGVLGNECLRFGLRVAALTRHKEWLLMREIVEKAEASFRDVKNILFDDSDRGSVFATIFDRTDGDIADVSDEQYLEQSIVSDARHIICVVKLRQNGNPLATVILRKRGTKVSIAKECVCEIRIDAEFHEQIDENGDGKWDSETCWIVRRSRIGCLD